MTKTVVISQVQFDYLAAAALNYLPTLPLSHYSKRIINKHEHSVLLHPELAGFKHSQQMCIMNQFAGDKMIEMESEKETRCLTVTVL